MMCITPFNGHACQQCMPCRINFKRKIVARMKFEKKSWPVASMLTLTYSDENRPVNDAGLNVLSTEHWRLFMMNLRTRLNRERNLTGLRFLAVGEYGHEGNGCVDASGFQWNPHYHASLFGFGCLGRIRLASLRSRDCGCGNCRLVNDVWKYGFAELEPLNDTTMDYVGGYTIKKLYHRDDLRLEGRPPEFKRASLGLGRNLIPSLARALGSHRVDGDVPYQVRMDGAMWPLDRYMREKIRKELGMEKINPDTGEVSYGVPEDVQMARALQEKSEKMCAVSSYQKENDASYSVALTKVDADERAARSQRGLNLVARTKLRKRKKSL